MEKALMIISLENLAKEKGPERGLFNDENPGGRELIAHKHEERLPSFQNHHNHS